TQSRESMRAICASSSSPMGWMTRTLIARIPGRARSLGCASGCEIESFHHARVGNLRAIVQLAHVLLGRCLEQAHAPGLSRHERAADVPHVLALGRHVLARLDRRFLGAGELIHRDALEIAFHHEYRHVEPPSKRWSQLKSIRAQCPAPGATPEGYLALSFTSS